MFDVVFDVGTRPAAQRARNQLPHKRAAHERVSRYRRHRVGEPVPVALRRQQRPSRRRLHGRRRAPLWAVLRRTTQRAGGAHLRRPVSALRSQVSAVSEPDLARRGQRGPHVQRRRRHVRAVGHASGGRGSCRRSRSFLCCSVARLRPRGQRRRSALRRQPWLAAGPDVGVRVRRARHRTRRSAAPRRARGNFAFSLALRQGRRRAQSNQ